MKLIVLFGPPAAGKMTVGMELAELTGFRLLHNNLALDLVSRFFSRGTQGFRLYSEFNTRIIEEAAGTDACDLIFTVVWSFSDRSDTELMRRRKEFVDSHGGSVHWVELLAGFHERVRRNATPLRLQEKPRQSGELTEEIMQDLERSHRLQSLDGEFPWRPYLRLDTEELAPKQAAARIRSEFDL